MKQRILERLHARKRPWHTSGQGPWNALSLAEAIERRKPVETTVKVEAEVPLRFINLMQRKGLLRESHHLDTNAIAQVMLSSTEEKLFGRVKAIRY